MKSDSVGEETKNQVFATSPSSSITSEGQSEQLDTILQSLRESEFFFESPG